MFDKTCIYSDTLLTHAPIGRLLAKGHDDVKNYVLKAAVYRGRDGAHSSVSMPTGQASVSGQ